MIVSRREFLEHAAVITAGAMIATSLPLTALAESVSPLALAKAGPLGDKALGDPKASVTMIEYASLGCSHCAHFNETAFPHLKKDYIDTGKVYYILREFPLDNLSFAAVMLARCAPEDQFFDIVDLFFRQQGVWAYTPDPLKSLTGFSKQLGFSQKTFEECLSNQDIIDGVNWVRDRANKEFGVNSTPTFFINGEMHRGAMTVDELDEILKPLL